MDTFTYLKPKTQFKKSLLMIVLVVFINGLYAQNPDASKLTPNDKELVKRQQLFDSVRTKLKDIACNINSPVEQSYMVKKLKITFNKKYLMKYDSDNYLLDTEKAIALGALGVNMAYLNMFEINSLQKDYLEHIYRLATDMNLAGLFDYAQIKRLVTDSESSSEAKDDLLRVFTQNVNQIEDYMIRSDRSHLGALIVAGAWLEGMHILTQTVKKRSKMKLLRERVAEQKVYIDELMKLLTLYKGLPEVDPFIQSFEDLHKIFARVDYRVFNTTESIEIENIYNSTFYTEKGVEISVTEIDDKGLDIVTQKVEALRTELLKI